MIRFSCLALLFLGISFIPNTTSAFQGGDGSLGSPFLIGSCLELQSITNTGLSAAFALANDIDCSDTVNWNSGEGFVPIGIYPSTTFSGSFDGRGHVITGLFIDGTNYPTSAGLFGSTAGNAIVENVGLKDVRIIDGFDSVGALVAYHRGIIQKSYVIGSIQGYSNVGGMAGESIGTISDSYASTTVIGSYVVGGLVGYSGGTLMNSYAIGQVIGDGLQGGATPDERKSVGGLVGEVDTTISDSFAAVHVSNTDIAGGIVGWNNYGTMDNVAWYDYTDSAADCYAADGPGSVPGNVGCTKIDGSNGGLPLLYASSTSPIDQWDFASTPLWDIFPNVFPRLHWQVADAPIHPSYVAVSTSSISWVWQSGGVQKDYYAHTTAGTIANSGWIGTSTWEQESLSPNTFYTMNVKARNHALVETATTSVSVYTKAPSPSIVSDSYSNGFVNLSVDRFINDTQGLSGYYFSNAMTHDSSGWIQVNTWEDRNVSCGSTYSYQVMYRNGDGQETPPASKEVSTGACPYRNTSGSVVSPEILKKLLQPQASLATSSGIIENKRVFITDLKIGSQGAEVVRLQRFLNTHGFPVALRGPGSSGNETAFFGDLTRLAVIAFQEKYRDTILSPLGLTKGTGYFGPATRMKANDI